MAARVGTGILGWDRHLAGGHAGRGRADGRAHPGPGGEPGPAALPPTGSIKAPKDAKVIADQVRTRDDLRQTGPVRELDVEVRLLVGRIRDLAAEALAAREQIRAIDTRI